MAIKTIEQIKSEFASGEYPSSSDYVDLIDTVTAVSGGVTQEQVNSSITTAINNLVDSAPDALNTLNELAAAIDDDASFSTTITNALANKSNVGHTHDERYYTETEIDSTLTGYYDSSEVDGFLASKSDTSHLHDDRYYTESEVDGFLSDKSDSSHIHDDRYYTESEVDGFLSGKSDTGHTHDDRYYTESETDNFLSDKASTGKAIAMAIVFG